VGSPSEQRRLCRLEKLEINCNRVYRLQELKEPILSSKRPWHYVSAAHRDSETTAASNQWSMDLSTRFKGKRIYVP
jgi:hypothetical protein